MQQTCGRAQLAWLPLLATPPWNAPVPSLGSGYGTPHPGTLGSPLLAPNCPSQPRQALWPRHLLRVLLYQLPLGRTPSRRPLTSSNPQPWTDVSTLCLRDHPKLKATPAPLLACPLGPSYLLTCLDTPHPPSPLDPKAEIHPKPPHPPPAPLMSLSTPTPRSPEGLPRPSSLAAS